MLRRRMMGIGATLLCNASKLSAQVRHVLLARWCKPRCRTRHMEEEAPVDPSLRLLPRSIMPGAHATWGEQSCVLFIYSESILIQTGAHVSTIPRHGAAGFILFPLPPTCMLCYKLSQVSSYFYIVECLRQNPTGE